MSARTLTRWLSKANVTKRKRTQLPHTFARLFLFFFIAVDLKQMRLEMIATKRFTMFTAMHRTALHFKYVKIAINNDRLKRILRRFCVAICQIKLEYLRWNKIESEQQFENTGIYWSILDDAGTVAFAFAIRYFAVNQIDFDPCDILRHTLEWPSNIRRHNKIYVYILYIHIRGHFGSCCYSLPHFSWFITNGFSICELGFPFAVHVCR